MATGLGSVALSFIPPDRPGYAPDIQMYQFDAAKAKSTLAEAGYPDGAGLPEIKLTYSSTPRNKTRMEWVQNQIKTNLGINATLDPVESKAYTSLVKDPATTPQVFYLGWCQDYPDPQDWLSLVFQSTSSACHFWSRVSSPPPSGPAASSGNGFSSDMITPGLPGTRWEMGRSRDNAAGGLPIRTAGVFQCAPLN